MRLSFRRIFCFGLFTIFLLCFFYYLSYNSVASRLPLYLLKEESHSYGAVNEIINPFAYPILIKPKLDICTSNYSTNNILIVIHSSVTNLLERSYYRTTIGRAWIRKHFGYEIIFVIGRHSSASQFQSIIEQESHTYGDILQGDFADTYKNLTIKAVVWMKYLSENCAKKNPFIIKMDDDVLIDFQKVKDILLQYTEELQNKYFCFSHRTMVVERSSDSPWYVPETEMVKSYEFYDEYCSGLAYITSTAVIRKQWDYLSTHKVHYHGVDDFFVTGKLAAEAQIGHINAPTMFELFETNLTQALDANGTFFLMHHQSTREYLWEKMLEKWTNSLAKQL